MSIYKLKSWKRIQEENNFANYAFWWDFHGWMLGKTATNQGSNYQFFDLAFSKMKSMWSFQ